MTDEDASEDARDKRLDPRTRPNSSTHGAGCAPTMNASVVGLSEGGRLWSNVLGAPE